VQGQRCKDRSRRLEEGIIDNVVRLRCCCLSMKNVVRYQASCAAMCGEPCLLSSSSTALGVDIAHREVRLLPPSGR
jgi:hypothetical protein